MSSGTTRPTKGGTSSTASSSAGVVSHEKAWEMCCNAGPDDLQSAVASLPPVRVPHRTNATGADEDGAIKISTDDDDDDDTDDEIDPPAFSASATSASSSNNKKKKKATHAQLVKEQLDIIRADGRTTKRPLPNLQKHDPVPGIGDRVFLTLAKLTKKHLAHVSPHGEGKNRWPKVKHDFFVDSGPGTGAGRLIKDECNWEQLSRRVKQAIKGRANRVLSPGVHSPSDNPGDFEDISEADQIAVELHRDMEGVQAEKDAKKRRAGIAVNAKTSMSDHLQPPPPAAMVSATARYKQQQDALELSSSSDEDKDEDEDGENECGKVNGNTLGLKSSSLSNEIDVEKEEKRARAEAEHKKQKRSRKNSGEAAEKKKKKTKRKNKGNKLSGKGHPSGGHHDDAFELMEGEEGRQETREHMGDMLQAKANLLKSKAAEKATKTLMKQAKLLEKGLITQDEFNKMKSKYMG